MGIFLLQARVALINRPFSFQLFPLLSISHFSLHYCLSLPFLSCPLFVCIHRILPFLVFGLPLVCWIRSAKWLWPRWVPPSKNAFTMCRRSIGSSWRWRIVRAWLAIRSRWDGRVCDANGRLVASVIYRLSLPISMRSTVSSGIWCAESSHAWWRTCRICSMIPCFVTPLMFWCLGSSKRSVISTCRGHSR